MITPIMTHLLQYRSHRWWKIMRAPDPSQVRTSLRIKVSSIRRMPSPLTPIWMCPGSQLIGPHASRKQINDRAQLTPNLQWKIMDLKIHAAAVIERRVPGFRVAKNWKEKCLQGRHLTNMPLKESLFNRWVLFIVALGVLRRSLHSILALIRIDISNMQKLTIIIWDLWLNARIYRNQARLNLDVTQRRWLPATSYRRNQ
jgi:hypothetical protein